MRHFLKIAIKVSATVRFLKFKVHGSRDNLLPDIDEGSPKHQCNEFEQPGLSKLAGRFVHKDAKKYFTKAADIKFNKSEVCIKDFSVAVYSVK